jgi:hypothetical protein
MWLLDPQTVNLTSDKGIWHHAVAQKNDDTTSAPKMHAGAMNRPNFRILVGMIKLPN